MVHVPFCNERSTKEVPFLSKCYKCIQKVDFEMGRPIYNTPTPPCVTKDVQIIVCGKRELLKTKVPRD